jgi:beta-galactosidase
MKFLRGKNHLRVVARKGKETIQDEITFIYQTEKWSKPLKLQAEKRKEENGKVAIEVKLLDDKNIPCLDAVNWIRFGIIGDGELLDNLGTSTGARYLQAYNGRAIIKVKTNTGKSIVSVHSDGLPTAFINIY